MRKLFKLTAIVLAAFMFISILGACKKDEVAGGQSSGNVTKTATAAKTTLKSTGTPVKTDLSTGNVSASNVSASNISTDSISNNTMDTIDNENEQDDKNAEEDNTVTDVTESESKTYDMNGREILVLTSIAMLPTAEWTTKVTEVRYKLNKEAEKLYNCKFKFEVIGDLPGTANKAASAVMAGVYFADAFYVGIANAFPSLEKNNIILPLNDYIDFNQPVYKKYSQVNGLLYPDKVYSFFNTAVKPMNIFYNKEILEREGIPDIQQLAANGNWKWSDFLDIALKTTHDFDSNGIIDQWGIGAPSSTTMAVAMMWSNMAPMIIYSNESSKYIYNLQNQAAVKALNFFSDLYHTYKVFPNKNSEVDFRNGKVAMFVREGWYGANFKSFGMTNIGLELLPQGPENAGNTFMIQPAGNFFFFPSNITDPEPVVNAMAHWLVFWDESKSEYVTHEGMLLSEAERCYDSKQNIDRFMEFMAYNTSYDYNAFFSAARSLMNSNVFGVIPKEQISPIPAIDSIKDQAQTIIDDIMGK